MQYFLPKRKIVSMRSKLALLSHTLTQTCKAIMIYKESNNTRYKACLVYYSKCSSYYHCNENSQRTTALPFQTAFQFSSVQPLSRVWLFEIPWSAARQASLSITNSRSLLKRMFIESVMPSNYLILCHPLLLLPRYLYLVVSYSHFEIHSITSCTHGKFWTEKFIVGKYDNKRYGLNG